MKAERERTPERIKLLANVLVGAIESGPGSWFTVDEYHVPEGREEEWYAVIREQDESELTYRVDLDTIDRGFTLVRNAGIDIVKTDKRPSDGADMEIAGYVNPLTGESLYISDDLHDAIMIADASDGKHEDLDVIGYWAILEIALFGHVEYA